MAATGAATRAVRSRALLLVARIVVRLLYTLSRVIGCRRFRIIIILNPLIFYLDIIIQTYLNNINTVTIVSFYNIIIHDVVDCSYLPEKSGVCFSFSFRLAAYLLLPFESVTVVIEVCCV